MEKFKGNPGPWEIIEHSWSDTSIYAGEKVICTKSIYYECTEETQEQVEDEVSKNFHLLAAAPELLEAAISAKSLLETVIVQGGKELNEYRILTSAINKALNIKS